MFTLAPVPKVASFKKLEANQLLADAEGLRYGPVDSENPGPG